MPRLGRKHMRKLAGAGAALLLALAGGFAVAQSGYPDKPIRILVGFSPGTGPDVTARLFADKWNDSWTKGLTVENITGAGGNLAVAQLLKVAPDGATLAMGGNAALVINPNLMDKLGYDPLKDFTYISQVFIVPNLVVVPPHVPAKDIQELIALAKAKPDYFVAGHAGIGTSQHLGAERFMAMTGVKIQQVPYRGTTQVLPDLLGGRLNIFFGNISNVLPLVRDGKLRAFAITSRQRSPQIPELPTMEELGFKNFEATAWFGLMGPAGMPKPIVDRIHAETAKLIAQPDVKQKLESLGLQLVGGTPAQFADIVKTEMPMWGKVIKDAGIKASP
jgi:tripartite-type tricarboxylate transporter receptor subunit TctC